MSECLKNCWLIRIGGVKLKKKIHKNPLVDSEKMMRGEYGLTKKKRIKEDLVVYEKTVSLKPKNI